MAGKKIVAPETVTPLNIVFPFGLPPLPIMSGFSGSNPTSEGITPEQSLVDAPRPQNRHPTRPIEQVEPEVKPDYMRTSRNERRSGSGIDIDQTSMF